MIRFKNSFLYLWLALPVPLWFTFSIELNAQPIESPPLELSLIIPGGVERDFLVGETISLNLSFRNNAGNPVYVVKPLEGSTNGLRYPHYQIQVKTPVPLYFIPPHFSCATLTPLFEYDFFRIEAGETRVLLSEETRLTYKPKMAGKHEIVCEIDVLLLGWD